MSSGERPVGFALETLVKSEALVHQVSCVEERVLVEVSLAAELHATVRAAVELALRFILCPWLLPVFWWLL